jgi:pilus assembly protein CpaE
MTVWKPLVVCPSPETGRRLRAALAEAGAAEPVFLGDYPRPGAIAGLAVHNGCNVCFVDLAPNEEQALLAIGDAAPAVPVVALNPRNDADVILRSLRRGACEFLAEPSAEQLRSVLERLDHARAPAPEPDKGRISCVVPGKPGCGASTLAAHLAADARSPGDSGALLVDADAMTGSIGFLLKLKSEYHLEDVLRDWKRMDDDLWSRLVTPCAGMDVLLAPENPSTRCPISPDVAAQLAAYWRKRYDTVVIDAPGAGAAAESGFAAAADDVLLVTTNELAALHATRRAIEFLEQTIPDRGRLRLILNRYNPATGLKREDVKTALRVEPFAILTNDYELLQTAVLEGKPAPAASRYGAAVHALSLALRGRPASPRKPGWLGRLSSRK